MPVHLLSDVDVVAISLVDKGANRRKFYLRKQDSAEEFEVPGPARIVKNDDWSAVYCVVAEPGWRENPGIGAMTDLEDEWASPDEIRKAAHRFMKNGALVNKMHETLEPYGAVVENFVSQSTFLVGEELVKEGAWVVGIEPTDEGKKAIEKGEFSGISIQGTGLRKLVEKKDSPGNEGPKAKKCPSCKGTVKFDKKTCQNCGHSFIQKAPLTAARRKKLPSGAFVFPKEKRYPIHDRAHAANALARASGKPEEATVKRAVCSRYPDLPACQALKKEEGTLMPVEDRESTGWLRAIGNYLGISKEDAELLVDEEREEESQVSEASDERLAGIEESIEKNGKDLKDLANRLADIAEALAGKNKEEEPPQPTTAEVYHRLEEVQKSLDTIHKDVEKLGEGDSNQREEQRNSVTKSDHPLAGLLSED